MDKIKKQINFTIYCVRVDQKKIYHYGHMSFNIFNYNIKNNKLIKINEYGKVGIFWFEKEWLNDNRWNNKYIII
tara:strand:- start:1815 stop:2036 length:222 start_codon:yes stop_codon:yes gene_type:complete